jgi:tetratricopeptide (TPR) repeat protein
VIRRRFSPRRIDRWLRGTLRLSDLVRLKNRDRDDLTRQAYRRLEARDYANALRLFKLLGELWDDAESLANLGQGVCAQHQGDLPAAEQAYDRVLEREPANLHALANRAEVRLMTGRREAARVDLDSALAALSERRADEALRTRIEQLKALTDAPA